MREALLAQVQTDLRLCRDRLVPHVETPSPARDLPALCKTAHELKGLAVTLGATRLGDLAAQAEAACGALDAAGLDRLLPDLADGTDRTIRALAAMSRTV